jgi:hypothetical protein
LADSGTLLATRISGLGAQSASLSVPNQISDGIGGEAYLIVGGQPVMSAGSTSLTVANGSVNVLYEIATGNEFSIDTLTIPATLLDVSGAPLAFPAQAVFGELAPVSNIGTASPTAPEPRFLSGAASAR